MCVCEKNDYCITKSKKLMLNPVYLRHYGRVKYCVLIPFKHGELPISRRHHTRLKNIISKNCAKRKSP